MAKYRVQVHTHNNTKDITATKCAADDKAAEVRNSVSWNGLEKFSKKHCAKVKFCRGKPPETLYVSIEKQDENFTLSRFYDITWL